MSLLHQQHQDCKTNKTHLQDIEEVQVVIQWIYPHIVRWVHLFRFDISTLYKIN